MMTYRAPIGPIRLAVAEAGRGGRRVMLVHGFTGAKEDLEGTLRFLAGRGWHAVAPDLRGHGASDAPAGQDAYDFETMAADLLALADHLGWARFVVVGYSLGGALGQLAALAAPARVEAMVLLSSFHGPLHAYDPQLVELGTTIVRQAGMDGLVQAQDAHRSTDSTAMAEMARLEALRPRYHDLHRRRVLACSPEMWLALAPRFHTQPDRLDRLARLALPTLVVVGSEDRLVIEDCRRLAAGVPGARLVVLPGVGHYPQLEAEDTWHRELAAFLDALEGPAGTSG